MKQLDSSSPTTRSTGDAAIALTLGACTWAYVWRDSIEKSLSELRALGYESMDVLTIPPHPFPSDMNKAQRSALMATSRQLGVTIETLNIPSTDVNLCSVNPDMRDYTIDQIQKTLELASDLEVSMLTTVPGRRLNFNAPDQLTTVGWLTQCLERLLPAAKRLGVDILLELHPLSCLPNTETLTSFLTSFRADGLGIALDVANADYAGDDPADAIRLAAPWLKQLHLSDTKHGKWQHDVVGSGDLDFIDILSALREVRFSGTSIVEITCDDPGEGFLLSRTRLENFGWQIRDQPDRHPLI